MILIPCALYAVHMIEGKEKKWDDICTPPLSFPQEGVGERKWAKLGLRGRWRSWWGRQRRHGLGSCRHWDHAMWSWPLPYLTQPSSSSGSTPPSRTSLTSTPPLTKMWVMSLRLASQTHATRDLIFFFNVEGPFWSYLNHESKFCPFIKHYQLLFLIFV